jgi:hypothetical protein
MISYNVGDCDDGGGKADSFAAVAAAGLMEAGTC